MDVMTRATFIFSIRMTMSRGPSPTLRLSSLMFMLRGYCLSDRDARGLERDKTSREITLSLHQIALVSQFLKTVLIRVISHSAFGRRFHCQENS
jgi:hypothetical protein